MPAQYCDTSRTIRVPYVARRGTLLEKRNEPSSRIGAEPTRKPWCSRRGHLDSRRASACERPTVADEHLATAEAHDAGLRGDGRCGLGDAPAFAGLSEIGEKDATPLDSAVCAAS
jgi:hypothetical protein